MSGVLVTGAASGLGRYLHGALGGVPFRRGDALPPGPWEAVVHCAANARRGAALEALRDDNVGLTERLLALPHARFVFVSTVEAAAPAGDYGRLKREAEEAVLARGKRPLVLRCGALLGPGMRPNALMRLLDGEPQTLAGDSTFDWVLYEDVLAFLRAAMDRGLEGIYNLVPSRAATLAEAARALGRTPAWGTFRYVTPPADGTAARAACPALARTALENAMLFAKTRTA